MGSRHDLPPREKELKKVLKSRAPAGRWDGASICKDREVERNSVTRTCSSGDAEPGERIAFRAGASNCDAPGRATKLEEPRGNPPARCRFTGHCSDFGSVSRERWR